MPNKKKHLRLLTILLASLLFLNSNTNNVLNIEINRLVFNDLCIQGNLSIDDEIIGYTLELPDVGNYKSVSSIKAGTYQGKVREDGSLGWRIELHNVENRKNIQIHIGNIRDNSSGCILVGNVANEENCTIGGSKRTLDFIKEKYYEKGNSNKKIIVTIID